MNTIRRALYRARFSILAIAMAYVVPLFAGMAMVHAGNRFSLSYRDRLIARAVAKDPAMKANDEGRNYSAAIWDFGENLILGALPTTGGGVGVVFPFPLVIYRGWVGGIVSVDSKHQSQFRTRKEGVYYLLTLFLQLLPYSLAGGAGVNMGIAYFRPREWYQGEKWYGIPIESLRDALRIYILVVPLFFIGSVWEFVLG